MNSANGLEVDGKSLCVCRAQKKVEREKELREKYENLKVNDLCVVFCVIYFVFVQAERQKNYVGMNLYIKNLADEVSDDELRAEFGKYGNITSAVVARDNGN